MSRQIKKILGEARNETFDYYIDGEVYHLLKAITLLIDMVEILDDGVGLLTEEENEETE